jgi:hypothetical protein
MPRKSFYLACVLASVPAAARDAGDRAWSALQPARATAVGLVDFDITVALLAAVAVALGLAWRRL